MEVPCSEEAIGREEEVDDGPVGATMHGADKAPSVRFYDQARLLEQLSRRAAQRVFSVDDMSGWQSPMAVEITCVEAALQQYRVPSPDPAIGSEVGALRLSCHEGALAI
jgi:hypothetical protein